MTTSNELASRRGFTLIEILVVVSIIALLISIMLPSLGESRRLTKKTVCLDNLHQIGVGIHAYLISHRDTFPYIARFPTSEAQVAKDANRNPYLPLPQALKRELPDGKVFECPADQNLMMPELGVARYFDREKTSYEWETELNGLHLQYKTLRLLKELLKTNLKDVWMVFDFEPFHGGPKRLGTHNVLYADLVVRSDKWNENRRPGQPMPKVP